MDLTQMFLQMLLILLTVAQYLSLIWDLIDLLSTLSSHFGAAFEDWERERVRISALLLVCGNLRSRSLYTVQEQVRNTVIEECETEIRKVQQKLQDASKENFVKRIWFKGEVKADLKALQTLVTCCEILEPASPPGL